MFVFCVPSCLAKFSTALVSCVCGGMIVLLVVFVAVGIGAGVVVFVVTAGVLPYVPVRWFVTWPPSVLANDSTVLVSCVYGEEGGDDDDVVGVDEEELLLVERRLDEDLLLVLDPLVLLPPNPDCLSLKEVLVVSLVFVLLLVFQPSFMLNRLILYHHLIFSVGL